MRVCSRREADRLIEAGRVTVDGTKAELGTRVRPGQVVKVGSKVVRQNDRMVLIALINQGELSVQQIESVRRIIL